MANKILITILFLAFFLRVYALNEVTIDHDEYDVYQRILSDETLWQIPFGDAQLNYHLLALIWSKAAVVVMGNSLFSLRWPSVWMSIVSIALIYQLGTWVLNKKVGLVAALLFTLNPYALHYAYNFRGYMGMMFYVMLAYYLAILALRLKQRRYWVGVVLVMALAVYNHLYAALGWAGLFWLVFWYSRYEQQSTLRLIKEMTLMMISSLTIMLILSASILWRLYTENSGLIQPEIPAQFPSPLWTLSWFNGTGLDKLNPNNPTALYLSLLIVGFISLGLIFKRPSNYRAYCLLGWFFLPLLIYHLGNWLIFPSILGRPRYFSFVLPYFLLLLALWPFELARFTKKFGAVRLGAAIGFLVLGVIVSYWMLPLRERYDRDATDNWPAVSVYLSRHIQPTDIVLCESFDQGWWTRDYHDINGNCRYNIGYWLHTHQVSLIHPVENLGEISNYDSLTSLDIETLTRFHRVWIVMWGVPDRIAVDHNRFGRTIVLPPPPASNAVEALSRHIEQLNRLTDDPEIRLIYHARLAQLANIQGQTSRVTEEWGHVEELRKKLTDTSPELQRYLETQKQLSSD